MPDSGDVGATPGERTAAFAYPRVTRDESVVDEIHGVSVADPYRWLENPDSAETGAFVAAQNRLTMPYLQSCTSRSKLHSQLTNMLNYPKMGCPFRRGDRYFYRYNAGLQNQHVLYVLDDLESSEPRVFLDPNKFSDEGNVSLKMGAFSEDGSVYAYGLSTSGSDWSKIYFRSVETGKDYDDVLDKVKFSSIAWTHDNLGVFYGRFNQEGVTDGSETTSNLNHKLYYHRLGTSQNEDILCVEFVDHPHWRIIAEVSECGRYLVIILSEGCKDNMVFYVDMDRSVLPDGITGQLSPICIVDKFEADYEYVTNVDALFVFRTNKEAPNYRLMTYNVHEQRWGTLIGEVNDVLDWAACVCHDKLMVCYMQDVKNVLYLHCLHTGRQLAQIPLDIGSIIGYSGRKRDETVFYQLTSFLTPGVIYRCDVRQLPLQPTVYREMRVPGFDSSQYVCDQVFYTSRDGTRVPMFIMHSRQLKRDGSAPGLLYGYGGFNISMTPTFSVFKLAFVDCLGGVFALPNIRGGGEYGERWHNGGRLLQKTNCFDDFAAAAEYLAANGYTSAKRLVCEGGSNGGLLVGATVNRRPELFGAAIAHVGVMDMLRYHRFTIGYAWTTDYGNPDEAQHFTNLLSYSPLHNVRMPAEGEYPAMLLLTADHDDRVVPLHTLKHIAELQHKIGRQPRQQRPLMVRVDTKAGHGAGKPTAKLIDEFTDIYCFIIEALKLTPPIVKQGSDGI